MKDDNDDKERRDVARTRIARSAKIIPLRHGSMIHCTVQNITSSGARLKLANTYGLPETFELTFEQGRTRRTCRVVWRTKDELGVAFADVAAAAG
jgi:ribosomal protein S1